MMPLGAGAVDWWLLTAVLGVALGCRGVEEAGEERSWEGAAVLA